MFAKVLESRTDSGSKPVLSAIVGVSVTAAKSSLERHKALETL